MNSKSSKQCSHKVKLSSRTAEGSTLLWNMGCSRLVRPHRSPLQSRHGCQHRPSQSVASRHWQSACSWYSCRGRSSGCPHRPDNVSLEPEFAVMAPYFLSDYKTSPSDAIVKPTSTNKPHEALTVPGQVWGRYQRQSDFVNWTWMVKLQRYRGDFILATIFFHSGLHYMKAAISKAHWSGI